MCGSDIDFEDFFIAMFTRTVLIPGQVGDFESWFTENKKRRGYGHRELTEMIQLKEIAIERMSKDVSPKATETADDFRNKSTEQRYIPTKEAINDSNEVLESPEHSLDKSDISANKSKSDVSANKSKSDLSGLSSVTPPYGDKGSSSV